MDIIFDTNTELCIMVFPTDIIFGINTELCIMVTFKLFICHFVVNSCRLRRWLTDKELACQCRRHVARVQPLGWEDPLEEGMATYSSILACRIHGQRSLVSYSPQVHKELDMTGATQHTLSESLRKRSNI